MTSAGLLTLYTDAFWISPYVFTCFVGLREKGIPFEIKPVALQDGAHRKPEYRDRSVTGRVPALDHGGFWLAESSAIIEYLDEAFPAPQYPRLLPEAVRDRARARQVMAWVRSDLMALREERPTTTMFYSRATSPLSPSGVEAADKLSRVVEQLIPAGATSLFGAWSIADSDLAFMLQRLVLNGHPVSPKLRQFAEAQWARPSVRSFVEQKRIPYTPY